MQTQEKVNYGTVPPAEMAKLAEQAAIGKAKKHPEITIILAIMAGIFVAIAGMFYTVVMAGSQGAPSSSTGTCTPR